MWCRASKSARGDGKFAGNVATPLQHVSLGAIFSTSVPKLKALRSLGCRLKHVMLFASGTSMLKMATLEIARINDQCGDIYLVSKSTAALPIFRS